jgi:hypothetical protein
VLVTGLGLIALGAWIAIDPGSARDGESKLSG